MMVVAHVAVGAALGAAVGHPVLGFALGVASHIVLDATPHFDAGSFMTPGDETYRLREYIWATTDVLLAVGFGLWLSWHAQNPVAVAAGGIGGLLPDLMFNPPFWSQWTRAIPGFSWFNRVLHQGLHWTVPASDWLAGTVTQLVAVGGALWWLGY